MDTFIASNREIEARILECKREIAWIHRRRRQKKSTGSCTIPELNREIRELKATLHARQRERELREAGLVEETQGEASD